jgi:hypothetical protein
VPENVGKDAISRVEAGHGVAHRFDDTRDIDPHPRVARRAQTDERANEPWPWAEAVKVGTIDRRRLDADEDLVLLRGGPVD